MAASLKRKPGMVRVSLTGRNVPPTIIEATETLTEAQSKHSYEKGVMAQREIEYLVPSTEKYASARY
jgi:ATP:corrinoid adenosyltransferase